MERLYKTNSAEETKELGKRLAREIVPGTLLCLRGDLGAGKTTFTQGLLEGFGAARPYVSPTFVIMKQYELPAPSATGISRIYHADAYRVEIKDFEELGFVEWCADPRGAVILEWPERIEAILPEKRIEISLTSLSENEREISTRMFSV
jgi:tRNA threonylcarbamoyl adenosine modification protein YjeE